MQSQAAVRTIARQVCEQLIQSKSWIIPTHLFRHLSAFFPWGWKAFSVLTTLLLLMQATCLATTPYWTRSPFTPRHQSEQYPDLPVSQVGPVLRDPRGSKAPLAGPVFLAAMARVDDQEREVREGTDPKIVQLQYWDAITQSRFILSVLKPKSNLRHLPNKNM